MKVALAKDIMEFRHQVGSRSRKQNFKPFQAFLRYLPTASIREQRTFFLTCFPTFVLHPRGVLVLQLLGNSSDKSTALVIIESTLIRADKFVFAKATPLNFENVMDAFLATSFLKLF